MPEQFEPERGLPMNRRKVLQTSAAACLVLPASADGASAALKKFGARKPKGWEQDAMRWVQLVFTEDDPARCDPQFWFDFFKDAHIDSVNMTAAGVSAFYPTKVPYLTRSPYLGNKDFFGTFVEGCRKLDMAVTARVDKQAVHKDMFDDHPDWVARNADGSPSMNPIATDLYRTCPNGPAVFEWFPKVLKEIGDTYQVDGYFGNQMAYGFLCFCVHCKDQFKKASGHDLPPNLDNPRDPAVRAWLVWDRDKHLELDRVWDQVIKASNPNAFGHFGGVGPLDPKKVWPYLPIAFVDRQGRTPDDPAWITGKYAKSAQAIMPSRPIVNIYNVSESFTAYRFEDSRQSDAETVAMARNGAMHNFRPWMGKFKAEVIDKRWVPAQTELMTWLWKNERYFKNTGNFARVALMQSNQTLTYSGEFNTLNQGFLRSNDANGFYQALVEARVPTATVDDRLLDPEYVDPYKVIILPNITAMSDTQAQQIRDYVMRGGAIVATNQTSLFDEGGQQRKNFALADLFGCDFAGKIDQKVQNSYLTVHGPSPLTARFDDAPRIMAGTTQVHVTPRDSSMAPPALTLVPSYQNTPMERVYTTTWQTNIPAVYARHVGKGRVIYTPHDIDHTYWELSNQDHMWLLQNMVAWALNETPMMTVKGPGMIDISYQRQAGSLTAHVCNLNNPMAMKGYMKEVLPSGPYTVSITLPPGAKMKSVRLLEADREIQGHLENGRLTVEIPSIAIHEVVAVDLE